MNSAFTKNAAAITTITANENLVDLTQSSKIGVCSEDFPSKSGKLLAKALGEYLGRLWHKIDTSGCYSQIIANTAEEAVNSCKFNAIIRQQWNPPYDFVIGIGTQVPRDQKSVSIGADGWKVNAGLKAHTSNDPNPVGPCLAAALAAAQAFKSVFHEQIKDETDLLPSDYEWNSWYGDAGSAPNISNLEFDEIHVFGVGAVSHGFFWVLQNWPKKIHGTIHLIDHDNYDDGNAQRYLGMSIDWIGKPKTEGTISRLKEAHPELNVIGHKMDMNRYFAQKNQNCQVRLALCGLDSKYGRQQLAVKLPNKIINMWTDENRVGATRFSFRRDQMCLYCAYPKQKEKARDEIGMLCNETGLKPSRIRELLDSGAGISEDEARAIERKKSIKLVAGAPIISVRSELCAQLKLRPKKNQDEVAVPLSFASGMAGVLGFIEIFREINHTPGHPGQIQIPILKFPLDGMWTQQFKHPDCYLCSDNTVLEIIRKKYS